MPRPAQLLGIRLGLVLLACCLAGWVEWQRPQLLIRFDEALRDLQHQVSASLQPENRVAVIDIDEASLQRLGPWPWPRQRIADLLEILLATYQVRGIGVDILFPEPADPAGDARLALLAEHAPVTLAQIFDYTVRSAPLQQGQLSGGQPARADPAQVVAAHGYIANHAGLRQARCLGNIGYRPDSDGVLRRLAPLTRFQGRDYPLFAATVLDCAQPPGSVSFLPQLDEATWRIPYPHQWQAYTVISAADILQQRVEPALLNGRYVLVGASSLSLGDHVSTPLAPLNAGVLVHAASLSALLDVQQGNGQHPWHGRGLLALWVLASALLFVFAVPRLPAWGNVLLLLLLTGGWLLLGLWGVQRGAEWSISAPLSAYLLLLATVIPFEWWQTQQRNKRLLSTFSRYVAPSVLNELVRRGMLDTLTPTLREVTILIADMESYTRTMAALSLPDAARLIRDFLERLTAPVLAHSGTLDKYTGDGLVAFWGAPLPCPEQADSAVSAALDILQAVAALNQQRHAEQLPPLRVRIGIESGLALVGDLGTTFRSSYTAVGDCINFASRLESAARTLPADVIIGNEAASRITQHTLIPLGSIQLRGTESMMAVFTVGRGHAG